ncbi:MAG TPA: hypothetical protein VKZ59_00045, partial [Acidobacteriota bacterium]|nr:hypothetical protein [Acidobacteriota bacterium]
GGAIPFHGTSMGSINNYHAENTYQVVDNLSLYRGAHILKMGVDLRRYQINDFRAPQSIRGEFTFDDRLSGFSYANFLLGYPSFARRTIPRPAVYPRSWQFGAYFQDDINVSPWLTINLGLRYDLHTPWVEQYDRMFTFDPRTGNLVTAGSSLPTDLIPEVIESLTVIPATEAGFPERSLYESDRNNWSPRVGIAIRPFKDATTVIRAGYGLYTQIWPGLMALRATGGPWESNQDFILPDEDVASIQFPNPFTTTSEFSGIQTISGLSSYFPNERTQQWNISVGRQIWDMALDVGYVGTRAMNIPYNEDLNLLPPGAEPFDPARRRFPRFNAVNLTQTGGSSIYHGLNIHVDRDFANGVAFDVNYTWAKALTDVDLRSWSATPQQNQYQRHLEKGDDPNIRRQQLRFSYIWELPFGRGRRYGSGLPVWADQVLGGWQLNGITTLVTGQLLSPAFSSTDPANTNQFGGRPDRVGDGNLDSGSMRDRIKAGLPIFDAGSFAVPEGGRGWYGNSARNILTGPGEALWNIVVAKNWDVANERARLQFRWELFNAFNRPNFANPSTNIESGTFGIVTRAGAARSMLFGLRLDY